MSDFDQNYLVRLSFLGTRYHGSQIQKNAVTVQELFQKALFETLECSYGIDIKCCSRTDSGVHAKEFGISFFGPETLSENRFITRMNHLLPDDIRVFSLEKVPAEFHARYSSTGKRYEYYVWNGSVMSPFWEGRAYHEKHELDPDRIREAACVLCGTHDFSSFCSVKSDVEDKIRTVKEIALHEKEPNLWAFSVTADGFLYNMARIIVGALIQFNRGKLSVEDIKSYLSGRSRDNLLITLQAEALYLAEVFYGVGK